MKGSKKHLPEFKVPYSSADVTRFHDAEGHLILPKGYEDILDNDAEPDYDQEGLIPHN